MKLTKPYVMPVLYGAAIASLSVVGTAYAARSLNTRPLFSAMAVALQMPVIGQRGKAFSITEMSVKPDSTIRISNDDDVVHTLRVTAPDGTRQDVGVQKPGESTDIPLERLGDYMVRCNIHPTMKLVVHVR